MTNSATVIVPTKNGEKYIEDVLEAIFRQKLSISYKLLVIDSGSTDNTLSILKNFPIQLHQIKPKEFGHGKTRNLGAKLAKSKYLAYLTDDATPANKYWLKHLLAPMEKDPEVLGVFGRQMPYPGCNPSETRDLLTYLGKRRIVKKLNLNNYLQEKEYKKNIEKIIQFSNVSSAFRNEALQEFPFNEKILMSEDHEWCKRALEAGYKVAYEPSSVVYHSHNFSIKKLYKRHYEIGLSLNKFAPVDTSLIIHSLRAIKNILKDWRYLSQYNDGLLNKIKWFFSIPLMRIAMFYGKYKGLTYEK